MNTVPLVERHVPHGLRLVADLLEDNGFVVIADALRVSGAKLEFLDASYRDQGTLRELAARRPNVDLERVKAALRLRNSRVLVQVGDHQALVTHELAQELRDAVSSR